MIKSSRYDLLGSQWNDPHRNLAAAIVLSGYRDFMWPFETERFQDACTFLYSEMCEFLLDCLGLDPEEMLKAMEKRRREFYELSMDDRRGWWYEYFRHRMPGEENDTDELPEDIGEGS